MKVVSILEETFDIMSAVDNATNQPRPSRELAYWLAHKEQFPILFHLAAVSAASSKSECVFYAAGHTVTPKSQWASGTERRLLHLFLFTFLNK